MDNYTATKVFSNKKNTDSIRKTISDILCNSDDEISPSQLDENRIGKLSNISIFDYSNTKKPGKSLSKAKNADAAQCAQEKVNLLKLKLKKIAVPALYSLSELSQMKRTFKTDDKSILSQSMKHFKADDKGTPSPIKKNLKAKPPIIKAEKLIKCEKKYLKEPKISGASEASISGISENNIPKTSETKNSGARELVISDILMKVAELENKVKENISCEPELEKIKAINHDLEMKCKKLENEAKGLSKTIQQQKGDFNKGMGIQVHHMEKKLLEKESQMLNMANTLKERESEIKILETNNKEKINKWIQKEKESEIKKLEVMNNEKNSKWITKEKALAIERKLSDQIDEFQGKYKKMENILKDKELEILNVSTTSKDVVNAMVNQMDDLQGEFKSMKSVLKEKELEIKKYITANNDLKVWKKGQIKKEKSILKDLEVSRIGSKNNEDIIVQLKKQLDDSSNINESMNKSNDLLSKKIAILELNCNEIAKKVVQSENREKSLEEELSTKNSEVKYLNHKIEKQSETEQHFYLELEHLNEEKDLAMDKNKQKEIFNKKLDLIERHCLKRIEEKNDLIERQKDTIIDLNNRISEQSKNEQNLMLEMTQIMTEATQETNKKDDELEIKDRTIQTKLEQIKNLETFVTEAGKQIKRKDEDLKNKSKDIQMYLRKVENLEGLVTESSEEIRRKDCDLENTKRDIIILKINIEKLEVLLSSLEDDISRLNKSNPIDRFEIEDVPFSSNLNPMICYNWPIVSHKSNQTRRDDESIKNQDETLFLNIKRDLLLRWSDEYESMKTIPDYIKEPIVTNWPMVVYKKCSLFNFIETTSTESCIAEEIVLENNEVTTNLAVIDESKTNEKSSFIADIILGCLDFDNNRDEMFTNHGESEGGWENAANWMASKTIDKLDILEDRSPKKGNKSSDKSCVVDLIISECLSFENKKAKPESRDSIVEGKMVKRAVKRKADDIIIDDRSTKKMKEECISGLLLDDVLDHVIVFSEIKLLF